MAGRAHVHAPRNVKTPDAGGAVGGCWGVVPTVSTRAPWKPSARRPGPRRTVERMGDTWERCAGRGDGTDCPNGEDEVLVDGVRCEECRHYWELDETEPGRRAAVDDGLTQPIGDPREAGPGKAA
jgi:hypothetical protein